MLQDGGGQRGGSVEVVVELPGPGGDSDRRAAAAFREKRGFCGFFSTILWCACLERGPPKPYPGTVRLVRNPGYLARSSQSKRPAKGLGPRHNGKSATLQRRHALLERERERETGCTQRLNRCGRRKPHRLSPMHPKIIFSLFI